MAPALATDGRDYPPVVRTATPRVYRRGERFQVKWRENGGQRSRTFETYDEARAFSRDYVDHMPSGCQPSLSIPPRSVEGYVYFAQAGKGGLVKIGWARDVGERVKKHQTSCPHPVEVIAAFPGSQRLERGFHRLFANYRRSGEWFAPEIGLLLERVLFELCGEAIS